MQLQEDCLVLRVAGAVAANGVEWWLVAGGHLIACHVRRLRTDLRDEDEHENIQHGMHGSRGGDQISFFGCTRAMSELFCIKLQNEFAKTVIKTHAS